jgi:hypothetical protein
LIFFCYQKKIALRQEMIKSSVFAGIKITARQSVTATILQYAPEAENAVTRVVLVDVTKTTQKSVRPAKNSWSVIWTVSIGELIQRNFLHTVG